MASGECLNPASLGGVEDARNEGDIETKYLMYPSRVRYCALMLGPRSDPGPL